jgi:hypothetical protein
VPAWAALLVVLAIVIVQTPRVWRTGQMNATGRRPDWWPYGEVGWLAWARVYPTTGVVVSLGCLSFLFGGTIGRVLLGGCVAAAFVCVSIVLFNRPRLLVPPPRRGDPGVIAFRG